jgi:hypothetical protein
VLPDILTRTEIEHLINGARELRYQTFILTAYSMGLRLGEVLGLQPGDIDSARMKVHVRQGKGRKDRFVTLPKASLLALRKYWVTHRNPDWIFPAGKNAQDRREASRVMDRGGLQNAFKVIVKSCGIRKAITPHSLRHCYGAHLMEAGLNLRAIQYQMGHECPKTTAVYTQLTDTVNQHTDSADQWSALNAILGCRTGQYGHVMLSCQDCHQPALRYQSCGHRACNQCQHHSASQWLERQQRRLLPVDYFMATFTLPHELRALAQAHPKQVYSLLFECAVSTLKDFGVNKTSFAVELAMTAVLHTHTRRLEYHPHVHIIVPGSGVEREGSTTGWKTLSTRYLFNGRALAKLFRARLLVALRAAGLGLAMTPKQWVVQCQSIGRGLPALKYLSRYLYRGVISDKCVMSIIGFIRPRSAPQ